MVATSSSTGSLAEEADEKGSGEDGESASGEEMRDEQELPDLRLAAAGTAGVVVIVAGSAWVAFRVLR